jgi:peroxiredoxin
MGVLLLALGCLGMWLAGCALALGEPPHLAHEAWTLRTADGDEYPGMLVPWTTPDMIRWQATGFTQPLSFPNRFLSSVQRVGPWENQRAKGEFGLEATGGNVLFGQLKGWDASTIELETESIGMVRVDRGSITNLYRWNDGQEMVYNGPKAIQDWKILGSEAGCFMDRGHLVLENAAASLLGDLNLPDQCRIDLEFSWSSKPSFTVAFGVADSPESWKQALRLEVWEDSIVVLRESAEQADIAEVGKAAGFFGELRLTLLMDQTAGRAVVYRDNGEALADVAIRDTKQASGRKLLLQNHGGPLRLKKLRVIHGAAVPSSKEPVSSPQVFRTDGSTLQGTVNHYDSATESLVVDTESGVVNVPRAQLRRVFPAVRLPEIKGNPEGAKAPAAAGPAEVIALLIDGIQLQGRLLAVEDKHLRLQSPTLAAEVAIPLDRLVSLTGNLLAKPSQAQAAGRIGQLISGKLKSQGFLAGQAEDGAQVEGKPKDDGESKLLWQPLSAENSSPLQAGIAGQIVYREAEAGANVYAMRPFQNAQPPPVQPRAVPAPAKGGIFGAALGAAMDRNGSNRKRAIYLRNGDVIPCHVSAINEEGIQFESSATKTNFVAHDDIKAVELSTARDPAQLSPAKLSRLLTLPRMQRKLPPKHLVVTNAGDYLRGDVLSLSEAELVVEVRHEAITVPRLGLSHIIWFHQDELPQPVETAEASTGGVSETKGQTRTEVPAEKNSGAASGHKFNASVQAICRSGVRLTFQPEQTSLKALMGPSPSLGLCHVAIEDIDRLLLGDEIAEQANEGEYHDWRWQFAPDPKVLREVSEADDPSSAGMESVLIGQFAPEFSLKDLNDQWFRLTEHRGKVVVLDFFASWCGPCVASMPEIDAVMSEFPAKDALLVAVNLQETPAQIQTLLDRLKLQPQVVLDEAGLVANAYGARAIPQTVLIDRAGIVARVFVGGGPKLPVQLKEAISEVLVRDPKQP